MPNQRSRHHDARQPDTNIVVLKGVLSSEPRRRTLPSGDEPINYEVTTKVGESRATVPVVWFGPSRPPAVHAGDRVSVTGTVRRRFFQTGSGATSRTEVVAELVARPGTKTAGRSIGRVVDSLTSEPGAAA